jgi:hypothetical protein
MPQLPVLFSSQCPPLFPVYFRPCSHSASVRSSLPSLFNPSVRLVWAGAICVQAHGFAAVSRRSLPTTATAPHRNLATNIHSLVPGDLCAGGGGGMAALAPIGEGAKNSESDQAAGGGVPWPLHGRARTHLPTHAVRALWTCTADRQRRSRSLRFVIVARHDTQKTQLQRRSPAQYRSCRRRRQHKRT